MNRDSLREKANSVTKQQFDLLISIINKQCVAAADLGYYYVDIHFKDHAYFKAAVDAWTDEILFDKLMNYYALTTSLVLTPLSDTADYCTGIRVSWGKDW